MIWEPVYGGLEFRASRFGHEERKNLRGLTVWV